MIPILIQGLRKLANNERFEENGTKNSGNDSVFKIFSYIDEK